MTDHAQAERPQSGRVLGLSLGGWALAVFVLALVVRLAYIFAVVGLGSPVPVWYDDGIYHRLASSLASGQGLSFYGTPSAVVSPGYPSFIGACYALFGIGPEAPRLLQSVLGALTAALLVPLVVELGLGLGAGALAGVAASGYPSAIYFTGRYFPMVVYSFCLTLAVYLLVRWGRRGGASALGSALALGAATLVRSDTLMLAPLLAASAALFRRPARQTVIAALLLLGCVGLLQGAWVVRNLRVFHKPVLTTSFAARVIWSGNNPWARGGYTIDEEIVARYDRPGAAAPTGPGMREQLQMLRQFRAERERMSEVQVDSVFAGLLKDWQTRYRGQWLANLPRKLGVFFNPWTTQGGDVLRRYRLILLASYGLLLPFAGVGFVAARRRGPGRWLVFAVLLQGLATALILFGHPRYRFAIEILFIPYGAFGLIWIAQRVGIGGRPGRA